jgi:hypothetical protein
MDLNSSSRRYRRHRRHKRKQHRRGLIFRILLPTVALFLVVAGFLLYWDQSKHLDTSVTAPAPTEVAEAESFPVAIRVVDSPSWLTVTVDGQTVLDQLGEPGFSEEFEVEREIVIDAYNAEAVWVVDEGEDLGPIGEGAMRFEITTEDSEPEGMQEEPTTAEATTPSREEESGVRVLVSVVNDGGVGISILADGLLVHDQVTSPGFSEEFEAEEVITVTAADGGAVQVGVGGENPQPLGEGGEWTTRTFTAEPQS